MKPIYTLIFVVVCSNLFAQQPFAPVGTKWYYGVNYYDDGHYPMNPTQNYTSYFSIEVIEEVIYNGKPCSKIVEFGGMGCYYLADVVYAYQANDTVYFSTGEQFYPVYVWGAQAGDSWETFGGVRITVDNVETINILGQNVKKQYVSYRNFSDYSDIEYEGCIIKNIGDLFYLYHFANEVFNNMACDEFGVLYPGLRCYVHPELGTYHTNDLNCDYEGGTALNEMDFKQIEILKDGNQIIVHCTEGCDIIVSIINIDGKSFYKNHFIDNQIIIPVENFPQGVYLIKIFDKYKNQYYINKIIL